VQRQQFEAYLDKVFDWSARVAASPRGDSRRGIPGRRFGTPYFWGPQFGFPTCTGWKRNADRES